MFDLIKVEVGPWPSHSYIVKDDESKQAYIIDAGADAGKILEAVQGYEVQKLLITHKHGDHIGAVLEVMTELGIEAAMNPADVTKNQKFKAGVSLEDGMEFSLGDGFLRTVFSAGHTPGLAMFELHDGSQPMRIVVGDAIFQGGPGKTWSAEDLKLSLDNLGRTVFSKPDDTELHPGHGPYTTVGAERAGYEKLATQLFDGELFGDVSW